MGDLRPDYAVREHGLKAQHRQREGRDPERIS